MLGCTIFECVVCSRQLIKIKKKGFKKQCISTNIWPFLFCQGFGAFNFSDFLLIGTWNWNFSQILFGRKSQKAAIVRHHKTDMGTLWFLLFGKFPSFFCKYGAKNRLEIDTYRSTKPIWFKLAFEEKVFGYVVSSNPNITF